MTPTPPKQTDKPVPIFLDADINAEHFRAVLVGSGLKMRATSKGIRIVLAAKGRK